MDVALAFVCTIISIVVWAHTIPGMTATHHYVSAAHSRKSAHLSLLPEEKEVLVM